MRNRKYKLEDVKKESVFDWTAQTSKKRPEPTKMIRIDLYHKNRVATMPKDIQGAIFRIIKRYVKDVTLPNVVINAEIQKVFSRNYETNADEVFYVICVTIDYSGDNPWRQRFNREIHLKKGNGKLYMHCMNYCKSELTKILLK